jgi:hypothetical protein
LAIKKRLSGANPTPLITLRTTSPDGGGSIMLWDVFHRQELGNWSELNE